MQLEQVGEPDNRESSIHSVLEKKEKNQFSKSVLLELPFLLHWQHFVLEMAVKDVHHHVMELN